MGLDPGRVNIYTAVFHSQPAAQSLQQASPVEYETLHCTAARFWEHSGANARSAKVPRWMRTHRAVDKTMRLMPTAHTPSSQNFNQHIFYRLQHSKLLANHITSRRYMTLRWRTYIHKQGALAMLCNEATANNRKTIVATGNAAFAHNSRGRPSRLTEGFKRQLAGRCRLHEVDKRNTSALCCACCRSMTGMDLGTGMYLPNPVFQQTAVNKSSVHVDVSYVQHMLLYKC